MRKFDVVRAVAALVALAAGCTPDPTPHQESPDAAVIETLTDYLDEAAQRHEFRGAVQVRLDGKVLVSDGYDQADIATDTPNGPNTRFRIASVTKQFTGLAVLMLQEQGKLRVTDPACTHLPICPNTWHAITVEQLLTHTAGLFNYTDASEAEADQFFATFGDTPTPDQMIQTIVGRPLLFPPGSKTEYTNSGYLLLGRIIEHRSGKTYSQFLKDHIFDPLHMTDTSYEPNPTPIDRDAVGYQDWTTPAETLTDAVYYAAGGIRSTVHDLALWQQFLLTGTPAAAKPGTVDQLLRPRVQFNAVEQYGYGIMTRGTGRGTTHFHAGNIAGFATYHEIRPATGLSIIVLSNLDTANATSIGRNLASLIQSG
jgi:CubicO group peptidase (beta-lactamase class C family)